MCLRRALTTWRHTGANMRGCFATSAASYTSPYNPMRRRRSRRSWVKLDTFSGSRMWLSLRHGGECRRGQTRKISLAHCPRTDH